MVDDDDRVRSALLESQGLQVHQARSNDSGERRALTSLIEQGNVEGM